MELMNWVGLFYVHVIFGCVVGLPASWLAEAKVQRIIKRERDHRLEQERILSRQESETVDYSYDMFIAAVLDETHESMLKQGVSDEQYQSWLYYVGL